MAEKCDLSNVAYTKEYLIHRQKIIGAAFHLKNKIDTEERQEIGCRRIIEEYCTEQNVNGYFCSHNQVLDSSGYPVFEYISLYRHCFFCTLVEHADGKSYYFYKEDLYGYSVYDIAKKQSFRYIPAHSWSGGETFIATSIHYNPHNNLFAVEGCYWAGPSETFLFRIGNPMQRFDEYLSLHQLLDGDYEKYDDIEFERWDGNDLVLKCYDIQTEPYQNVSVCLSEKDYLSLL